jgi:hypothetical protein
MRRLINVLFLQRTRSIAVATVCAGHAGDVDTKHEPDELTTPAASPSSSNDDHERRLPY